MTLTSNGVNGFMKKEHLNSLADMAGGHLNQDNLHTVQSVLPQSMSRHINSVKSMLPAGGKETGEKLPKVADSIKVPAAAAAAKANDPMEFKMPRDGSHIPRFIFGTIFLLISILI